MLRIYQKVSKNLNCSSAIHDTVHDTTTCVLLCVMNKSAKEVITI